MKDHLFKPGQSGNPNGSPKRPIDPRSAHFHSFLEKNKSKINDVCTLVLDMALQKDWKAIKLVIENFIPRPGVYAPDEGSSKNELSEAFSSTWGSLSDEERKAVFMSVCKKDDSSTESADAKDVS
jgi:hypothetical protein